MTSISERRTSSRAPASTSSTSTSSTSSTSTAAPPASPDEHVEDVDTLPPRDTADGFARSARPDRSVVVSGSMGDDGMHFDNQNGFTVEGGDATMIGRTPPPRAAPLFTSVEQGIAALEAKYGVTVGREGWSVEDLSRVHESLALLGAKEREELKGVHLAREASPSGEVPMDAAGFFFPNVLADASGRTKPPTIVWYDDAFPSSNNARIDRRHTMQVVLHEVAHAFDQHDASDVVAADNTRTSLHGTAPNAAAQHTLAAAQGKTPYASPTDGVTHEALDLQKMLDGEPLVSPYAEMGPPENFAEVYAVYRRDPQWLNEHHPKAAHWMRKHYP